MIPEVPGSSRSGTCFSWITALLLFAAAELVTKLVSRHVVVGCQ